MAGSVEDWEAFFGEDYLRSFLPFLDEERTRTEALGAVRLAGAEPGAEVLDCPVGSGRHAVLLADEGFEQVEAFDSWDEAPVTVETVRAVLRLR